MTRSMVITRIVLWAWVIAASILAGGGIFEHMVLSPMWQGSPPESVMNWPHGGIQRKFFIIFSPAYYLCSLAMLIASFWMPRPMRIWARIAGVSGVIIAIATFGFFIPILNQTQVTRGAGLSGEEITRLVNEFKSWNIARFTVMLGGWIAGLRAFSMSAEEK
jgi:hypothetical protein